MKKFITILVTIIAVLFTTQKANSQDVSGTLMYMNKGIAPVPSFSIDQGAVYSDLTVDYGKIEIFLDMAFRDTDGHVWFTDIWLRYYPVENIRFAADFSTFGQSYNTSNEDYVWESTRYVSLETYLQKPIGNSKVSAKYWYTIGLGNRTTTGHFTMGSFDIPLIKINKTTMWVTPMVFYISFDKNNNGLFSGGAVNIAHDSLPFILFGQVIPKPFITDIEEVSTEINFGIAITF